MFAIVGDQIPDQSRLRDLLLVLRDVRGWRARTWLLARLVGSRLGLGRGTVRVPFRRFEAEFELSQGEITPYAQMVRDVRDGVLPIEPEIRDWTVMDCGANVGLFSLFMKGVDRVVAVEPNPDTSRRLKGNLDLNQIRSTVIEAAVSDEDGTVRMDFDRGPSVLTMIDQAGSEVRAATIDTLLAETGLQRLDLLKLDVEYHEIEALSGCAKALRENRIQRIVAEFTDGDSLAALDQHLAKYGFDRVATGRGNARFEL